MSKALDNGTIIYALETQIIHAARMETFNVQYVTTLHDRAVKHASRIPLRYFRTFTLRASGTGYRDALGYQNLATLLGTWLDINATRFERTTAESISYTRYLNIGILNL